MGVRTVGKYYTKFRAPSILERLDQLEEQRLQYEAMRKAHQPILAERDSSDAALQCFINKFRTGLAEDDVERNKAAMRSVIAERCQTSMSCIYIR